MTEINIDISGDDGEFEVRNPHGFDLQIYGYGLYLDLTFEQANELYVKLKKYLDDEDI